MHPGPATYSLFFKLALSFSVACLITSASAQLVNTTVDDTSGDPLTGATILYEPASSWKSGNLSVCANCTARPDAFHASGETWHEGLSLPSLPGEQSQVLTAGLPFNGSAVYVYCIIAPFWPTNLTFHLDGESTGTFALEANTSRAYEYGVLVYASAALPLTEHTLTIQSGGGDGNNTLVLLDRIVYTHDPATRASNTSSPAGASTSSFSGPLSTSNSRPNATLSSSNVYAITIPCVIGGMVLVGVVIGLWGKFWGHYKCAGLPPSALYRRSVGAGTQPQPLPESRWIGGGGAGRRDLASTSLRAAEEAAAVEQDRPGDVGPRELPERTRGEQGHGTPHHGTAAEEIEEVSRS